MSLRSLRAWNTEGSLPVSRPLTSALLKVPAFNVVALKSLTLEMVFISLLFNVTLLSAMLNAVTNNGSKTSQSTFPLQRSCGF